MKTIKSKYNSRKKQTTFHGTRARPLTARVKRELSAAHQQYLLSGSIYNPTSGVR